jgi:hypothetical protein
MPVVRRYRHAPIEFACNCQMIRFVLSLALLWLLPGHAQSQPQPPCGRDPDPPYPSLDNPPSVKFWSVSDLGREWKPPECTDWDQTGFSTMTTTVARFRYTAGAEGLLRRIGAISDLAGMRYWSATHKQWQTLIVSAHALSGPRAGSRRQDFAPAELTQGKVVYMEQTDNLSGTAIYRIRIEAASADRIVYSFENVSVMRYLFVTLFDPGEMQSIYFLDRESDNVWRFYSIARTGRKSSRLTAGHAASSINRAVAFYRRLVGVPTDQDPPAAR